MPDSLEPIDIYKLHSLFTLKKWFNNENQEKVHRNFCELLINLSSEQKQLIHELLQDYCWIPGGEYNERFNHLLKKIDPVILKKCKKIYLFRIVTPRDEKKTKSSDHCVYLVKGLLGFYNVEIQAVDLFEDFKKIAFQNDGTELIFLIDDFIGTGETFEECWLELKNNPTVTDKFVFVFTLVIQEDAFKYIFDNFHLSAFYSVIKKKGISNFYIDAVKADKIRIMEEIEDIIKPRSSDKFGYQKSEALVTMIRTPDNTFPVFWKKYKIKGVEFNPPFPR